MKRIYKIKAIHLNSKWSGFSFWDLTEEYQVKPMKMAFIFLKKKCTEEKVSFDVLEITNRNQEAIVKLRGKRKNIKNIIIDFNLELGEYFTFESDTWW